jgi:hypothetical protein
MNTNQIKLNNYNLDDFQELSTMLGYVTIDGNSYRFLIKPLGQLSWALDKKNKYIKGVAAKRAFFLKTLQDEDDFGLKETTGNREKNAQTILGDQLMSVFNCPYSDIPLLVNSIDHFLAKLFISWRLKIGK